MNKQENNEGKQQGKKTGRPKTLETMSEIMDDLNVKVKQCDSCGAKPATERHYANGRVLCRKCSRPYFVRHLNKITGLGILIGVVLYFVI